MKLTFEQFWDKLVEHEIWYEQIKMRYYRKDLRGVAQDCYISLLAQEQRWIAQDYQDFRNCYRNFLSNAKDKPVGPTLQQVQTVVTKELTPEEIERNKPLTGEERQKKLAEWLEKVNSEPMFAPVPKLTNKQIAEEGQWLPKKAEPYKPDNDIYLYKLKEAIHEISGAKYKGRYRFDGFKHFNMGIVTVFAESLEHAKEIIEEAEKRIL